MSKTPSSSNHRSIESSEVVRKSVNGAISLGVRQILVQGARIVAGIFLARILTPAQFGVYAVILYLQTFLIAFGDAGLAGSLVRQHDEPEIADYQAIFTIQQVLVLLISAGLWFSSRWIAASYHMRPNEAWLFRLVALSFVATSFMVVPQIRLERKLEFHKVALIDSIQAIVFNVCAVVLAWKGFGAYSFAIALLLRALSGAIVAFWISPWAMRWHWDWVRVKSHMAFGLPYQGIQAASLLKDSISPVLVGFLLGTKEVGYITWASMLAAYPVLALMVLQRIYMPAFARLQHKTNELRSLVENVIWSANALVAPLSIITLVLIQPITVLIYGSKWLVATPYFYFFWMANLFVPTATPVLSLLNALGRSRTALTFALIWMAGTWVIGAPLILAYGTIGFAIANLLVQFSNLWLYRVAQRWLPFRVYTVITPVWMIAAVSGALVFVVCQLHHPGSLLLLGTYAIIGLVVYFVCAYVFFRDKLHRVLQQVRRPV